MDLSLKYPYLWELSGGKPDFVKMMLSTFIQSSEEYKKELSMAMTGSEKEISQVAHKVKSACKIVGAGELAEVFETLQGYPDQSSLPSVMDSLDRLVVSIKSDLELL